MNDITQAFITNRRATILAPVDVPMKIKQN